MNFSGDLSKKVSSSKGANDTRTLCLLATGDVLATTQGGRAVVSLPGIHHLAATLLVARFLYGPQAIAATAWASSMLVTIMRMEPVSGPHQAFQVHAGRKQTECPFPTRLPFVTVSLGLQWLAV